MSRSSDNKSLFPELGRATMRGIRKCPKCGTVNGTRGNCCKNKACDMVFRDNGASKKSTTEACKIVTSFEDYQIYSVRLRDRGPDYRNFVQIAKSERTGNVTKCYVDACQRNKEAFCSHVESTQRCFSESQPLAVKHSTVMSLNLPSEQQQILSSLTSEEVSGGNEDVLVQRVSKTSFIVKCEPSVRHPLGYLHIMFLKHNHYKEDEATIDKKFLCTCKFKASNREGDANTSGNSGDGLEASGKFCMHFYTCLAAFASDDNLSVEFEYFLSQLNPAPTLLSQFHLVTLPPAGTHPVHIEGLDPNNSISVEIMRENLSLLDSIAVDDGSLQHVQNLDQIIVTVDDSLNFGDSTVLDGLVDGDSQVCQIFTSSQDQLHCVNSLSNSENVHQAVNITSAILAPSASSAKRRRIGSGEPILPEIPTMSTLHSYQPLVSTSNFDNSQKTPCSSTKVAFSKGFPAMITYTAATPTPAIPNCSPSPQLSVLPVVSPPEEAKPLPIVEDFDMWLAGVTERLNATMNYHFSGKPDPLVYYISVDYFERLRERLTAAGARKKRLPNQTVVISRTDKPPAGVFTKHVWKITNIMHVHKIFHNQILPLKVSQYFIKGSNGMYEEWKPPKENDKRNQLIKPRVHKTFLKVGKNDPTASESVPFTIEWIPDIFPSSKLGEVTIIFEFAHCSSATKDEFK